MVKQIVIVSLWGLISAVASYWGWPFINGDFIGYVVTAFSILAGFVLAALTLLGEPGLLTPGTWREAQFDLERIKSSLGRYQRLFLLYISVLLVGGLHFFTPAMPCYFSKAIKVSFAFLSVFSLGCSLALPSSLIQLQLARLRDEIKRREQEEKERLKRKTKA